MVIVKGLKLAREGLRSARRYRSKKKKNRADLPTFLVYQFTNSCNSRCTMCNIWQKSSRGELDTEQVKKIFSGSLFQELRWINLTGGEPFLRKDILKVTRMLNRLPRLEGIAVPSNGLVTKHIIKTAEEMLRILDKDKFLSVTLSIDGFEKTHDAIRGVPGGFRKVMATLEGLKKLKKSYPNFNVGVQPTISKKNIDEMEGFYRFIKKKTPSVGFAVCLTSEGYYDNMGTDIALDAKDKKRIGRFMRKIVKNDPQYGFYYLKLAEMFDTGKRGFGCMAGFGTAYMDPFGNIYPCPVLSNHDIYNFGNALELDARAWNNKKAQMLRKRLKKEKDCEECTMMCDFINFAKVEFIEHSTFMMMHPAILFRLMKKIAKEKNPYF